MTTTGSTVRMPQALPMATEAIGAGPLSRGALVPGLRARTASAAADRLLVLDAARVAAALGVVWFHTIENADLRDSGVLGRFSVAFYTIIAVLFLFEHLEKNPERSFWVYAWGRVKRLYLPFLAWTAVSLPVLMCIRRAGADVPMPGLNADLLVSGATLPLWFIPFVVVSSVLVFPIAKWAGKSRRREYVLLGASLLTALCLDYLPWGNPPFQGVPVLGKFCEMSWNRWSAVYWGMALAIAYRRWIKESEWRSWIGVAGLSGTIFLVGMMWEFGPGAQIKVITGLCFALLTLAPWRGQWIAGLAKYGYLSFGVYFSHMTVVLLLRAAGNRLGIEGSWQRDVLVFGSAILICVGVLRAMERARGLRWMIG